MGEFVIAKRSNGEYQFSLNTGHSQLMLASEGYKATQGCENGIESVRKNALELTKFDLKTTSNGKPNFNLNACNDEIIGISQMHTSIA